MTRVLLRISRLGHAGAYTRCLFNMRIHACNLAVLMKACVQCSSMCTVVFMLASVL